MRHPDERFDIKLDLLFYRENETAWNLVALGLLTTCAAAFGIRNTIPRLSILFFALPLGCSFQEKSASRLGCFEHLRQA